MPEWLVSVKLQGSRPAGCWAIQRPVVAAGEGCFVANTYCIPFRLRCRRGARVLVLVAGVHRRGHLALLV